MNDESEYPPIPMSPDHLAKEFAKRIAGKWHYVNDYKSWFYHDGEEWQMDKVDEIKSVAVTFCNAAIYWPEAASLSANEKRRITYYSYIGNVLCLTKYDRLIVTTSEKIGLPPKKKNDRGRYPCP